MPQRISSHSKKWPFLFILVFNLTLFWVTFVYASDPGDLDTTFNGTGIVTTTINGDEAVGTSVAIQPDGNIVVAGNLNRSTDNNFVLVRYENDGSLDVTFNTTGTVVAPIGDGFGFGPSVGLQSDGKIVVAGSDAFGAGGSQFATVRYNADGSLDTTFNNSGVVTTSISSGSDFGSAVAIQPDNKILVAGRVKGDIGLVRYTITGTLDTTFNGSGVVTTSINDGGGEGYAVALQPDDKILVAGVSIVGGNSDFAVIRYNSDGSLDTTFDSTGIVTTSVSNGEDDKGYYGIALQTDGKVVVAGEGRDSGDVPIIVVARYNQNGSLDTIFNGTGIITTSIGSGAAAADVAIQPNGKIVVVGVGVTGGNSNLAVVRYNVDGSLDSSFGGTGIITTTINGGDVGRSVAIQPDGKIVVAGLTYDDGNASIVAVRYIGELIPCYLPIILRDGS